MSDPREPHYPSGPDYSAGTPQSLTSPQAGVLARLDSRARRRPEPRLGVSLAGAGIALAVIGVLVWSGDYLTSANGGTGGASSSRQLLGVGLSLLVVAVGYFLAVQIRQGPLATAGVAASALGLPVLLGFTTFDSGSSGLPFSLDAVVIVSVVVWLGSYLVVPGTRGHSFYLGLATVVFWLYVLDKAEPSLFTGRPFLSFLLGGDSGILPVSDRSVPDWTTVAALSLIFGLVYYATAFLLDRSGRPGVGVGFLVGGFLATWVGIAATTPDLHALGTGIVLVVIALALSTYGARAGRRFTTWAWTAGIALGVSVIIDHFASNNSAAAGVALILSGVLVVAAGHLLRNVLHEPEDVAPDRISAVAFGPTPAQ
jgi:hypothetical protein